MFAQFTEAIKARLAAATTVCRVCVDKVVSLPVLVFDIVLKELTFSYVYLANMSDDQKTKFSQYISIASITIAYGLITSMSLLWMFMIDSVYIPKLRFMLDYPIAVFLAISQMQVLVQHGFDPYAFVEVYLWDFVGNAGLFLRVPKVLMSNLIHVDGFHLFGNALFNAQERVHDIAHYFHCTFNNAVLLYWFGIDAVGASMILSAGFAERLMHTGVRDIWDIREIIAIFYPFFWSPFSPVLHALGGFSVVIAHFSGHLDRVRAADWYQNFAPGFALRGYNFVGAACVRGLTAVFSYSFFDRLFTKANALPLENSNYVAEVLLTPSPLTHSPTGSPTQSIVVDHGHMTIDLPASLDLPVHLSWMLVCVTGAVIFIALSRRKTVKVSGPGCNFVSSAYVRDTTHLLPIFYAQNYRVAHVSPDVIHLVPCARSYTPCYSRVFLERKIEKDYISVVNWTAWDGGLEVRLSERCDNLCHVFKHAFTRQEDLFAPLTSRDGRPLRSKRKQTRRNDERDVIQWLNYNADDEDDAGFSFDRRVDKCVNDYKVSSRGLKGIDIPDCLIDFGSLTFWLYNADMRALRKRFPEFCQNLKDESYKPSGAAMSAISNALDLPELAPGLSKRFSDVLPVVKGTIAAGALVKFMDYSLKSRCPNWIYEAFFADAFRTADSFEKMVAYVCRVPSVIKYVLFDEGTLDSLGVDEITRIFIRNDTVMQKYRAVGPCEEVLFELSESERDLSRMLLEQVVSTTRQTIIARIDVTRATHKEVSARIKRPQPLGIWLVSRSGRANKTAAADAIARAIVRTVYNVPRESESIGLFSANVEFQTNIYPNSHAIIGHDLFTAEDPKALLSVAGQIHSAAGGEPFEANQAEIARKGHVCNAHVIILTSNKIGFQLPEGVLHNQLQFMQRFPICVEAIVNDHRDSDGHSAAYVPQPGEISTVKYDITWFMPILNEQGACDDTVNCYAAPRNDLPHGKFCRKNVDERTMLKCVVELAKLQKDFNARVADFKFECPECHNLPCDCADLDDEFETPSYVPKTAPVGFKTAVPIKSVHYYKSSAAAETFTTDTNLLKASFFMGLSAVERIPVFGWYGFLAVLSFVAPWWICVLLAIATYLATVSAAVAAEAFAKYQKYRLVLWTLKKLGYVGEKGYVTVTEMKYKLKSLSLSKDTKFFLSIGVGVMTVAAVAALLYTQCVTRAVDSKAADNDFKSSGNVPVQAVKPPPDSRETCVIAHALCDVVSKSRSADGTIQTRFGTGVRIDSMSVLTNSHSIGDNPFEVKVDGHQVNKQTVSVVDEVSDLSVLRCSHSKRGCLPFSKWINECGRNAVLHTRDPSKNYEFCTLPVYEVEKFVADQSFGDIAPGAVVYSGYCAWVHGMCGSVLATTDGAPVAIGAAYSESRVKMVGEVKMYSVIFVSVADLPIISKLLTHGYDDNDYRASAGKVTAVTEPRHDLTTDRRMLEHWTEDLSGIGVTVGVLTNKQGQKPGCTRKPYEFTEEAYKLIDLPVDTYRVVDGGSVERNVDGVTRKVSPVEDYVSQTAVNQKSYDDNTQFDLGFDVEEAKLIIRKHVVGAADQFTKRPVTLEEAIAGNHYVTPLDLSTSAGLGLGKKREHMTRQFGDQHVPIWLINSADAIYDNMMKGVKTPITFSLATKRDEIRHKGKMKVRTINVNAEFARQIAQRRLFLPILEWLARNGRNAFGFMPGVNMHNPFVVGQLFKVFEERSTSDDVIGMEAFHAAILKELSRWFIECIAECLGYTEVEMCALRNELVALDYPGMMIGWELVALSARNASGHGLTTWVNCIRMWLAMLLWSLVYRVDFNTIVSIIYGDDQVRRHSEEWHYLSFADFCAKIGFRISSAFDKLRKTDPGDLSKFEFLKRSLVYRNGTYYAPLNKLSVIKSLMYPRHKKIDGREVLLREDFKNTVMMAMRESYIGDYQDVMTFALKLSNHYGFGLNDLPAQLHEQYIHGKFTFDYVLELARP